MTFLRKAMSLNIESVVFKSTTRESTERKNRFLFWCRLDFSLVRRQECKGKQVGTVVCVAAHNYIDLSLS